MNDLPFGHYKECFPRSNKRSKLKSKELLGEWVGTLSVGAAKT